MAGRRRSDRALRPVLHRSPGRPSVAQRENRRRFWAAIAAGLSSGEAALGAGVSQPVGSRWFREAGGMPPQVLGPSSKPLSERYLSLAEREEIALLRAQGCGVRETARRLGRDASTISRELRRNAATRCGNLEYRATTAQWHAGRAARRPKAVKRKRSFQTLLQVACRSAIFCGRPVPRHEFVDTALWPSVDQPGQQVGEVDLRIDAVQLARLDQRCEVGPAAPAVIT